MIRPADLALAIDARAQLAALDARRSAMRLDAFARLLWLSSESNPELFPSWEEMPEIWRENWRSLAQEPEAVESLGWSRSAESAVVYLPNNNDNHTTADSAVWHYQGRITELAKDNARLEKERAALAFDLAKGEARIAELEKRVVLAETIVDRVAAEQPGATIERLEERVAELSQEKAEILTLARDPTLPHATRIFGILAKERGRAYRRRMELGRPPPDQQAQRIYVGALEVEAGIGKGHASQHVKPLVARGHFRYTVQSEGPSSDPKQDTGTRRSIVLISPGDGTLHEMEDLRRKKERDKKAQERADRLAQEARDQARIAELEHAAQRAAQGCPLCGDTLLPTGYHCAGCGSHQSVQNLAVMPPIIVLGHSTDHTNSPNGDLYIRSKAAESADRHILGSPKKSLPPLDPWLERRDESAF